MKTDVFINLPVNNLEKSKSFFKHLGFDFKEQFSNEQAACIILNNESYVMLLQEKFFQDFTKNAIADTSQFTEVLLAISVDSIENVDLFLENALRIGAREAREPQDNNFMYGRSFHDLDGHIWEIFWMDPSGIPQE